MSDRRYLDENFTEETKKELPIRGILVRDTSTRSGSGSTVSFKDVEDVPDNELQKHTLSDISSASKRRGSSSLNTPTRRSGSGGPNIVTEKRSSRLNTSTRGSGRGRVRSNRNVNVIEEGIPTDKRVTTTNITPQIKLENEINKYKKLTGRKNKKVLERLIATLKQKYPNSELVNSQNDGFEQNVRFNQNDNSGQRAKRVVRMKNTKRVATKSFPSHKPTKMKKLKKRVVNIIERLEADISLNDTYNQKIGLLWELLKQLTPDSNDWIIIDFDEKNGVYLLSAVTTNLENHKVNFSQGYELLRGVVICSEGILSYSYGYSKINICNISDNPNFRTNIFSGIDEPKQNHNLYLKKGSNFVEYKDSQNLEIKQYLEGNIAVRVFFYKDSFYICTDKWLKFQEKNSSVWDEVNLYSLIAPFFTDKEGNFSMFNWVKDLPENVTSSYNFLQLIFINKDISRTGINNLGDNTSCVILGDIGIDLQQTDFNTNNKIYPRFQAPVEVNCIPYNIPYTENEPNVYILNSLTIDQAYKVLYNPYFEDYEDDHKQALIEFYERAKEAKDEKVMKCNGLHITEKNNGFDLHVRALAPSSYIANSLTNGAGIWTIFYTNLQKVREQFDKYQSSLDQSEKDRCIFYIMGYYSLFDPLKFLGDNSDSINVDNFAEYSEIIYEEMVRTESTYLDRLYYMGNETGTGTIKYFMERFDEIQSYDEDWNNLIMETYLIVFMNYMYFLNDERKQNFRIKHANDRHFSPKTILKDSSKYITLIKDNLTNPNDNTQILTLGVREFDTFASIGFYGDILNEAEVVDLQQVIYMKFLEKPLMMYNFFKSIKTIHDRYQDIYRSLLSYYNNKDNRPTTLSHDLTTLLNANEDKDEDVQAIIILNYFSSFGESRSTNSRISDDYSNFIKHYNDYESE